MTGNYSQFLVDGNGYTIMLSCVDCAQIVLEDSPPVTLYDLTDAADRHDCEAGR